MSIIRTVSDDLLAFLGCEDPTQAKRSDITRILSVINAVGQGLATDGPSAWWSMDDGAGSIQPPTTVSGIGVTAGSTAITGTFADWMHGATIKLDGEHSYNQLRRTGASTWTLEIPYTSTTGTVNSTVYGDVLNLTRSTVAINPPVDIPQYWMLHPALSVEELRTGTTLNAKGGGQLPIIGGFGMFTMQIHTPTRYLVEPCPLYTGEVVQRLRVYPLPNAAFPLRWKQKKVWTNVADLSDPRPNITPHGYDDSIFKPLCRDRFAGFYGLQDKRWSGDKQQLAMQAEAARTLLAQLTEKQVALPNNIEYGGNR